MWAWYTGSEYELRLAVAVTAAELCIIVLLILAVFVTHAQRTRRRRQQARIQARWRPILARALAGPSREPPQLPREDAPVFMRLWLGFRVRVDGEAAGGLEALAGELELGHRAAEALAGTDPEKRLLAVHVLGYMRDPGASPRLLALLKDSDPTLSYHAALAALDVDPERALPDVLYTYMIRADWPRDRLAAQLGRLPPDRLEHCCLRVLGASRQPARLLHLLERLATPGIVAEVRERLESFDPESQAAGLRLLGLPGDREIALRYLEAPDAMVRVQAIRLLGRVVQQEDLPVLRPLLEDPHPWVRIRAAQTLALVPGVDRQRLEQYALGMPDGPGRRVLMATLSEGGYG